MLHALKYGRKEAYKAKENGVKRKAVTMAYTTFTFYKDVFYGDVIADETAFNKWAARATDKLNYLTFGNVTSDALEDYDTQVQKATCALIDVLYQIDYATKNATDAKNGNVKSKSSGNESITFGSNDTLITAVMSDQKAQYKLMTDAITEHLQGTGLLYAGV